MFTRILTSKVQFYSIQTLKINKNDVYKNSDFKIHLIYNVSFTERWPQKKGFPLLKNKLYLILWLCKSYTQQGCPHFYLSLWLTGSIEKSNFFSLKSTLVRFFILSRSEDIIKHDLKAQLLFIRRWAYYYLGCRPAFFKASESNHSICPFTLRKSSAAHFSNASIVFGFSRSANAFFLFILESFDI